MELEKRTQQLIEEIQKKVDNLIEDLNKKYEEERLHLVQEYENEAREETSVYLEQELSEIKLSVQLKESQAKWKAKKDLFVKRQELVDDMFKDVYKKLMEYSSSKAYDLWLKGLLEKHILSASVKDPITIEYKPIDKLIIERAAADHLDKLTLVSRETIFVGGFIVSRPAKGIEIDETLDTKYKQQKEWFTTNSGLDF